MSDPNVPRAAMPVLPSRAAGEAPVPQAPPPPVLASVAPPAPRRQRPVRAAAPKRAAAKKPVKTKKNERLSAAEAKALKAKRAKALRAKRKAVATVRPMTQTEVVQAVHPAKRSRGRPAKDSSAPRKNPNRPLELKNQLNAVISVAGSLSSSDLKLFAALAGELMSHSKASRKAVLAALSSVYA